MIFAIDPGTVKSAYVFMDDELRLVDFGIRQNEELMPIVCGLTGTDNFVIEMVASYGMPVGAEVFDTCVWIGRFWEAASKAGMRSRVYRMEEKMNLCHDSRANDANIRQALIDRFGPVGTKKSPGWFYGVSKDVWAAVAVGVTWKDKQEGKS